MKFIEVEERSLKLDADNENTFIADNTIQPETEVDQALKDNQNQLPSVINSNNSNFKPLNDKEDEIDQLIR